jgi:hypothetical protein
MIPVGRRPTGPPDGRTRLAIALEIEIEIAGRGGEHRSRGLAAEPP